MHQILLFSNQIQIFSQLLDQFNKNNSSVHSFPLNFIHQALENGDKYDFILVHIDEDKDTIKSLIKLIRQKCHGVLFIFSQKGIFSCDTKKEFFDAGSEGFIEIPFSAVEISSLISAVLRYVIGFNQQNHVLDIGPLKIDLSKRIINLKKETVPLTRIEYRILEILIRHKNLTVEKDKIIRHVYTQDYSATDNALGIHIMRLRKKLEWKDDITLIETIWGVGYRLNVEDYQS